MGNGFLLPISHIGLSCIYNGDRLIPIRDVFLVPSLRNNLISIQQFFKDYNCLFLMDDVGFIVKDTNMGKTLLHGTPTSAHGGLYHVQGAPTSAALFAAISSRTSTTTWHKRLGLFSSSFLQLIINEHALPVSSKSHEHYGIFLTIGDSLYGCFGFLLMNINNQYLWIFSLQYKSDVLKNFLDFTKYIKLHLQFKVRCVQSDGGGQFNGSNFVNMFRSFGIAHTNHAHIHSSIWDY